MIDRRQRLAWILLLAGFIAFLGMLVSIPIAVNWTIQEATRSLNIMVQANQGTVGVLRSDGETVALFTGDPAYEINAGSTVLTNAADQAFLLVNTPDNQSQAMRVQIYGNTHVSVDRAMAPRFSASSSNHDIALTLNGGRLFVGVPEIGERDISVRMSTPQGVISFNQEGQYSISSSNTETLVAVLDGEATVTSAEAEISLISDQRVALLSDGSISGPFGAERNLVTNGGFADGLSEWVGLAPNVEIADQSEVEVDVQMDGNEPILIFRRVGLGHADAGMRQIIGEDVTDYSSLSVAISMEVAEQSLGVCGQQGSECPLILRIEYVDMNGVDQIWQQGFFAVGEIGSTTPDVCVACPPPLNEHQRVPYKQLVFYESDNLMEKLRLLNAQPQQIKSLTLIASGHTFDTRVVDIALMARE
ncbi:MAG TPA: hypothetical protein VMZ24_03735 [Patescibacteria group bacterium]|nr:hypothetical protein [Patescibacteria group bacterium]